MKRVGFTLIELLVVIAIIAILAAILFPVFAQAREKARQITCISNEKQIGLAILQYVQDYDEVMPIPGFNGTCQRIGTAWDGRAVMNRYDWRWAIQPYVKSVSLPLCPDYERPNEPLWASGCAGGTTTIDWLHGLRRSYAGCHSWAHPAFAPGGRKLAEVSRPATLIMVLESRYEYPDLGTWTLPWRAWLDHNKGAYTSHNGKSNWLFFDGHVKAINPCATFGRLNWNPGDTPPDDYLWEWWSGPNPNVLRRWQHACYQIPEYH